MSSIGLKKRKKSWYRRRWLDFRQGHSIYLVFLMTFANFITIQYALLIDRIPALNSVFGNMWIFATVFITAYVPIAIIVGYWHRKSQWKVEAEAMFKENEIGATMWLFVINLIDGKVTDAEKKEMREMLSQIAKKDIAENDDGPEKKNVPRADPKIDSETPETT